MRLRPGRKKTKSDEHLIWQGRNYWINHSTGASHASHLGDCCPSAYSSRVSYVKNRQVWKSRLETYWPHLGISPDFSTAKSRSILILTSTCWQEISLSNTVSLTTVIPQKQKICCFKGRFFASFRKFQRFHCLPICSKSRDTPWLGRFVFTYVCSLSNWNGHVCKNKTTQSWRVTGFAARRQTMEPLEFSKTGKKRPLKWQIFCFCGMTVISSMVFEREISCQYDNVKWERCDFFLWRNLAIFPGEVSQFLIRTFTPVSSLHMILCYYRPMDSNHPSD